MCNISGSKNYSDIRVTKYEVLVTTSGVGSQLKELYTQSNLHLNMKIMLIWDEEKDLMKLLFDRLEGAGHEITYWVGTHSTAEISPGSAIFHDHYDAWDAKPAEALADTNISPPSAKFIASHYDTESFVMTMMDKHYDTANVDERKHIYYTMLAYWNYVLDTQKPEAVIIGSVPHSIYGYIVYDLARKRGIKTICFDYSWVANRLIPYHDIFKGNEALQAAVARLEGTKLSADDLGKELQAYWLEHTKERSETPPIYMVADDRDRAGGLGLLRHRYNIALRALRSGRLPSLVLNYVKRTGKDNLKKAYARSAREVDWETPFVYYPLSMQPETATSPMGGVFHDQILVAEMLAAALPEGWELYVKEHPVQYWLRGKERYSCVRYPGYYERLARIPRVRLVYYKTNSFELIERASAVATITGTAGWEALLRGKCPLVFGFPSFRDCPGIFHVYSVESCERAYKEIQNCAKTPREDVLRYLKAYEENSIPGKLVKTIAVVPQHTIQPDMEAVASYLCKELAS